MDKAPERRLAAVLFSDIKGYSQQMGADEAGTLLRLQEHNRIFRAQAEQHRGRVIKTVGDAFMIEFASAVDAVTCALSVQTALAAHNQPRPAAEHIEVRIGVHVGDVVAQDGDLFGETVNLAARLEPRAPVGGVCVTDPVLQQVRRKVNAQAADLGLQSLKNIAEPMRLYALTPAPTLLESLPGSRPARRLRWPALLGGAAVAALAVGAGLATHQSAPVTGGVLRVGMPLDRGALDLYTHVPGLGYSATRYAVETAAVVGSDGEVTGGVVERWAEREGGKQVDLFLRRTARFHPHPCLGPERPVTNADLAYSIEQLVRSGINDLAISGAQEFRARTTARLSGITGRDGAGPLTLTLDRPSPFVDTALVQVSVVPADLERCHEAVTNFSQPVGTGPFRFTQAPLGEGMEVTRFAAYSGPGGAAPAPLDGIRFIHVADVTAALGMLRSGELDVLSLNPREALTVVTGLAEGHPVFQKPDPERDPVIGLETRAGEITFWGMIVLRGREGPMSHRAVREALALVLDRAQLVKRYPLPLIPSGRILEPRHLGHNLALTELSLDPGRAQALLADAGFPEGQGLEPITIGVNVGYADVGDLLTAEAASVGLKLKPIPMEREALATAVEQRQVDLAFVTNVEALRGTEPYPCLPAMAFMASAFLGEQPKLAEISAQLVSELDRQKRRALYSALEKELLSTLWYIPVAVYPAEMPVVIHLVSRRVQHLVDPISGRVASSELLPLSQVTLNRP